MEILTNFPAPRGGSGETVVTGAPGLVVLDDDGPIDESTQHERWRTWLSVFNTFQTLPGFVLGAERWAKQ